MDTSSLAKDFQDFYNKIPEGIRSQISNNANLLNDPNSVMNSIVERVNALLPDSTTLKQQALRLVQGYNALGEQDQQTFISDISYLWKP